MAMIRKCKLSWAASEAEHVVGYRLYWSKGTSVGYDSECIEVGKVTEIGIPDGITPGDGPMMFGITALDREGNESDMTTIAEPFLIQVPEAPRSLSLEPADEFIVTEEPREEVIEPEVIQRLIAQLEEEETSDPLDPQEVSDRQEAGEAHARVDIGTIF